MATQPTPVNINNFKTAESDFYFSRSVKDGAFGKFVHNREMTPLDKQIVVRMNRDTVYSNAVFDLDTAPVTITLPDSGKRFMSMQIISEDHYAIDVVYAPCSYTVTKDKVGTRYVMAAIRTLANPTDPADMKAVHALQDAIRVEQASIGKFEIPDWDQTSQNKAREALEELGSLGADSKGSFGKKSEVDPVKHLIGTAVGWGGNPEVAASYVIATPKQNDGKTVYSLTVKDVPVDGFWSVTVYNAKGFFEKNDRDAYSINNIIGKPNADGSFTVQFGVCEKSTPNCLPIIPGWNYAIRMYRPRPEILNGIWKFPEAVPVGNIKKEAA